jgi:16S rRNA (guanine966-N2)-methyltransferase
MSLRIISGRLRGKKLHTVRGMTVRPTADRLRESIFNILASRPRNAIVLDLFAGTGALGIEALSRGAEYAVFIDNSREALSVITRNIEASALSDRAKIIKWDIARNLDCIKSFTPAFNLVFIDPPYNRNQINPSLINLIKSESLAAGAWVVLEQAATETLEADPQAFAIDDQRKYGKTLVSFLSYVV